MKTGRQADVLSYLRSSYTDSVTSESSLVMAWLACGKIKTQFCDQICLKPAISCHQINKLDLGLGAKDPDFWHFQPRQTIFSRNCHNKVSQFKGKHYYQVPHIKIRKHILNEDRSGLLNFRFCVTARREGLIFHVSPLLLRFKSQQFSATHIQVRFEC